MHVLITNDDGIEAPGLKLLAQVAKRVFARCTTVAPASERSGASHAITLHDMLRIHEHGPNAYAIGGTPVDCVIVGLGHHCAGDPPALVISGVNAGPNLGWDVYYSGTVAAAREAVIRGLPGMAISLVGRRPELFGPLEPLLEHLLVCARDRGIPKGCFLNINIPKPRPDDRWAGHATAGVSGLRGIKLTRLGQRNYSDEIILRTDPRGRQYAWIGGDLPSLEPVPGTDCHAVEEGYVSVTPLGLELSDGGGNGALASWVNGMNGVNGEVP
jgi:5'-nucleotidase